MDEVTPGQLLRDARRRHGVSQARLATRAGTTQSAISRIESDRVSPSVETLRSLLHLLGEDLVLEAEQRDSGIDRAMVHERFRLSPAERVEAGRRFADQVIENSPGWRRRKVAA
ncbi:MAG: helix-turn-helix domain-containing protein [Solirubrobacterales bacterium]